MNCPAASTASSWWRFSTLSALAINAAKFAVSAYTSNVLQVEFLDLVLYPGSCAAMRLPMELQVRPLAAGTRLHPRRSEDAAGAVLVLTGDCSSSSSCSPASTSLRMRRRPEMSTKPCCCPAALNHAQRYDHPAPCEPKSLTRSPVALFLLPLPLGPLT